MVRTSGSAFTTRLSWGYIACFLEKNSDNLFEKISSKPSLLSKRDVIPSFQPLLEYATTPLASIEKCKVTFDDCHSACKVGL